MSIACCPEIRLQGGRLILWSSWSDDFGRALAGGKYEVAWQVERRAFLVRPNLEFPPLLGQAEDDAPDAGQVDRAGAASGRARSTYKACILRGTRAVVSRRTRREKPFGVSGAVATFARKYALLP